MLIQRKSAFTGKYHTRNIDITNEQLSRWTNGGFIQDICPDLSEDDREFLISGVTPDEWDNFLNAEE